MEELFFKIVSRLRFTWRRHFWVVVALYAIGLPLEYLVKSDVVSLVGSMFEFAADLLVVMLVIVVPDGDGFKPEISGAMSTSPGSVKNELRAMPYGYRLILEGIMLVSIGFSFGFNNWWFLLLLGIDVVIELAFWIKRKFL